MAIICKSDLVRNMADELHVSQKLTRKFLESLVSNVQDALKAGDKVQILDFGTFEVRQRRERKGTNPSSGESMIIPAYKAPVFRPGAGFKKTVR